MKFKRHLITAALPYANGPVHIGHLAGCYLPADIYVRYLRSKGEEVIYVCGSDEHGVPITIKARQENVSPQQVVDKYHGMMKESFAAFGISFDIYSRTSSTTHHRTASDFFKVLYDKGIFAEKVTRQYFDEEQKQFLADRYITGTCPRCGYENAYGDQCEKCGTSLNPTDLVNPKSALSGKTPVLRETRHWFLPLDQFQEKLSAYILRDHKEDWKANVYGQCKSWLDEGLQPRAVTRDLDWGVKVPLPGADGKVLYVWFDAPIGYISATKELLPEGWEKYWKSNETRLLHFIGKDNIVFHCIVFPAMLMAHGDFILPENVPANEFLNLEGEKISTSRNWAVWLHEYLLDFPGKQDILRYVLCSNMPETKDNDFSWKDFLAKNNNELVAILGNFVNRTIVLTQKYFQGRVPHAEILTSADLHLLREISAYPSKIAGCLDRFRFREALAEVMNLARAGNKYLADNEPWKAIKNDEVRVKTVLNICLQISANLSVLMEPFLPFTATRLTSILQMPARRWADASRTDNLPDGHLLGEAVLLFEKLESSIIEKQMDKLSAGKKSGGHTEPGASITDFQKLDIRVGKIIQAEDFPEAQKPAYKLRIDFGKEIGIRTSSARLCANYTKEQLKGRMILAVVNLPPRKVGPFVSEVLTLGLPDKNNECILVEPEKSVEAGGRLF